VAPLDAATAQLCDVSGGLLPITGTVTLTVRVGTYSTSVTCGVVRGMSVPLLLGTYYTDVHVPNICGPKGYIQLLNGCKVPILRRGKTVSYARADQPSKAGAASGRQGTPGARGGPAPAVPGVLPSTDVIPRKRGHHAAPSSV